MQLRAIDAEAARPSQKYYPDMAFLLWLADVWLTQTSGAGLLWGGFVFVLGFFFGGGAWINRLLSSILTCYMCNSLCRWREECQDCTMVQRWCSGRTQDCLKRPQNSSLLIRRWGLAPGCCLCRSSLTDPLVYYRCSADDVWLIGLNLILIGHFVFGSWLLLDLDSFVFFPDQWLQSAANKQNLP